VEIGLHESCMQGRPGYRSGVRPNHWMPGKDYTFMGQVDFIGRDLLSPGECCEAIVKCIIPVQDLGLFEPGFIWQICEANRIMGYAKVLSC
ncbi:hypothetical protein, partial [Simiduia agarivorans]